jgi:hypothetical protein
VQGLVLALFQLGEAFGHGVFHAARLEPRAPSPEIATARRHIRNQFSRPTAIPGLTREY